jgi:predicted RNA-binding protein with PIN domain
VARTGEDATPPVTAPGPIRKLLRFSRLPDRALATVRRVLDEDPEFRVRVAEVATEDVVGRASWLWLARPDGWEDELGRLDVEAARTATSARAEQDERSARRRLAAAEEARRRADATAAAATGHAARASEELTTERLARRAAEARAETLTAQVAELEAQVEIGHARAEGAEREGRRLHQAGADLVAERDRLRDQVETLAGQLAEARARPEEPSGPAQWDATAAVAARIAEAALAAGQLGVALAAAAELFGWPPAPAARAGGSPGQATDPTLGHPAAEEMPERAVTPDRPPTDATPSVVRTVGPRRQPTPLPPAVFDDTADAALHLLRVPGMILLVDGYNVSLQAWPDIPIPEQRGRLVDALAGLAARTAVEAQVVFDGAEQAEHRAVGLPPRSPVRVRFSPPDVDADDVLIELVDTLPPGRPVTVATSDRRVQDEVRHRGGNVISTAQLLAVLTGR